MYGKLTSVLVAGVLGLYGFQVGFAQEEDFSFCVNQPYGTEGCPIKTEEVEEEVELPSCGNSIIDENEECDVGRFNGITDCTENCKVLFCGDGVVSGHIGEECEPEIEEFYVLHPITQKLTIEIRFKEPMCGESCSAPICDGTGFCSGGCTRLYLEECTVAQVSQDPEVPEDEEAHSAASSVSSQDTADKEDDPALETVSIEEEGDQASASSSEETSPSDFVPTFTSQPENTVECGNGVIERGEQCDDGNAIHTDNCPNTCLLPVCGNGVREGREECDDGNANNYDNCPNTCQLSVCGDGVREGTEQCDDGNFVNTDDCPNNCQFPYCGNGIKEGREECDDGNQNNFDQCPNDCVLAVCGDNTRESSEQCDDGNRVDDDGCTNACTLTSCGDGTVQKGEECDDGNKNNTDSCPNDCQYAVCGDGVKEGDEECDDGNNNNVDACLTTCTIPVCGNGKLEGDEECDDGNALGEDGCTRNCRIERVCGDGFKAPNEECDNGKLNSDTNANACRLDCKNPTCGDGVQDDNEECDGSENCTSGCAVLKASAPVIQPEPTNNSTSISILLISFGAVVLALYTYLRKDVIFSEKLTGFLQKNSTNLKEDHDDSTPWHNWER